MPEVAVAVAPPAATGYPSGNATGPNEASPAAWRVLDLSFGQGQRMWACWLAWCADPARTRVLHFVGLCEQPPSPADLRATAPPTLAAEAEDLAGQWTGLLPGFHRFCLDQGRVLLTLCVGQRAQLLRELRLKADTLFLDGAPHPDETAAAAQDPWLVKALARCARLGSRLVLGGPLRESLQAALRPGGFVLAHGPIGAAQCDAVFQPHWVTRRTRRVATSTALLPADCVVLGAGLAGAGVAAALARRGWRVQVLDQAGEPAAGASSLPAGLLVPHVSADDCPLSRLSRCGLRLALQQARDMLRRGQDWDATGALQRGLDAGTRLPAPWPGPGQAWSRPWTPSGDEGWQTGVSAATADLWHPLAAWIKPAALVRAWLLRPGVQFRGGVTVAGLRRHRDGWALLDADGRTLLTTPRLVLAHAHGVLPLLRTCPELGELPRALHGLHPVAGLVSWGLHTEIEGAVAPDLPPFPVNGAGSLLPAVPLAEGLAWLAGATYDAAGTPDANPQRGHQANLSRLGRLLPAAARRLAPQVERGQVRAWQNARCVSPDRLPLLGPVHASADNGLWVCTGLGSRGLTFAALCAELLAARWGGEPWPLPASLARALEPWRGAPRDAR